MTTIRLQVVTFSGGQSANKHVNCISSEPKLFRAPWSVTWLPRNAGPQVWNVLLTQNIKSFAHRVLWLCPCLDLKTFRELHFPSPAGQSGQAAMLRNLFHIWPATGERGEWSRGRYLDIYAQHWPDMEPEMQTFGYCICIDNLCCLQFCPSHIFVHCRAKNKNLWLNSCFVERSLSCIMKRLTRHQAAWRKLISVNSDQTWSYKSLWLKFNFH